MRVAFWDAGQRRPWSEHATPNGVIEEVALEESRRVAVAHTSCGGERDCLRHTTAIAKFKASVEIVGALHPLANGEVNWERAPPF